MTKLINIHCHLLNCQFISPSYLKIRSKTLEWMLRHNSTRPLVRTIAAAVPGIRARRLYEVYDLMKMEIRRVAGCLRQEMEEADIQMAVPLVMDLGRTAFTEGPQIPFNFQIKLISDISLEHLGVIMPFLMVDPRRTRASDLLVRALEDLGYYGVKMYPALGYHPDPDSFYNDPQTNDELRKIYAYCEKNLVPITTHCSPGGAYSADILRQAAVRAEVTKPSSWAGVLKKFPGLYLNLAHFGQDLISIQSPDSWSHEIRELIHAYPGVYTDLAYNKAGLMPATAPQYFGALHRILDSDKVLASRILFGTDWSMTRHTWKETEYVAPFRRYLGENKMRTIAFENSLDFLFPKKLFPVRIHRFLTDNGRSVTDMPAWLIANVNLTHLPAAIAKDAS